MPDVTQILEALDRGDLAGAEQLLPLLYDELRRLAAIQMAREKPGQTLDATALVHEAYLRLVGDQHFENRRHFFAAAAEAMRRILVENARREQRLKHGGDRQRLQIHADLVAGPDADEEILALDAALARLAVADPLKARLVELRYFAGLTGDLAAEMLNISSSTADRHWVFARAWLRREMESENHVKEK